VELDSEVGWHWIRVLMDYMAAQALVFIKHNPDWALFIIGLTAFGESFVFLSLFFPGTAILIAAGALVSEGVLQALPTIGAGLIGAVLGDSVSFWLGEMLGPALTTIWPYRGHPERLSRGIGFFQRYGAGSVFIGRFFGPLRAVVPLVAGMMCMPPLRFYTANVLSALVWAPALVLFGDQLIQLLGQERLATKILYVVVAAAGVALLLAWLQRQFLTK
jgi:membrane protein DedA with SNARE-associated domain